MPETSKETAENLDLPCEDASGLEPQWVVAVSVPMRVDDEVKNALFETVADAARAWEATNRMWDGPVGWDVQVDSAPESDMWPTTDYPRDVLEFLFARHEAHRLHERPRCYGRSSDALAFYGAGHEPEPLEWEYPRDPDDLGACERTYEMAPGRIKPRMLPVLEKYRAFVAKDYSRGDTDADD